MPNAINGTYRADTGFVLDITAVNTDNGTFEGTYEALGTPHAKFKVPVIGTFHYVGNMNVQTKYNIEFKGVSRPLVDGGWPYCVVDSWVGIVSSDNTITANGVRAWTGTDNKFDMQILGEKRIFTK